HPPPTSPISLPAPPCAPPLSAHPATSYTRTKTITWSGLSTSPAPASQAPPSLPTRRSSDLGASTTALAATAYSAPGPNALTATGSGHSTSAALTPNPLGLDHFVVNTSTTTPTAGSSFTATLSAHDLYDNAPTSYTWTKTITC